MIRRRSGRAAWTALSLILACGCATIRPVSVDQELARHKSPMVRGGLWIDGYFDDHGLYHRTGGRIRRVSDGTLELSRPSKEFMRSGETIRLSADSVHTVVARKGHTLPFVNTFVVTLALAVALLYGLGAAWAGSS